MKKLLDRIDRAMGFLENGVLIAAISAMIIVCMLQIINRRLINLGIMWSEEIMRILLVWVICAGASVAAGKRLHLGVTFIVQKMKKSVAKWIVLVTDTLSVLVCVYIIVSGVSFVSLQFQTNAIFSVTRLPQPVAQIAIPICFSFAAIRIIFTMIGDFSGDGKEGDSNKDNPDTTGRMEGEKN